MRVPDPSPKTPSAARARVRRGNAADAEQLRAELLGAAFQLFVEGGLAAISLRAVATRVGVSPMTTYRYFADKAALLYEVGLFVVGGLHRALDDAVARAGGDGRMRQRALIEASIDYWESHPDHYALMHGFGLVEKTPGDGPKVGAAASYAEMVALMVGVAQRWAEQLGGEPARAKLATDLWVATMLGYLRATMEAGRYPWCDRLELRAACVDHAVNAVERCLLQAPPALSERNLARPVTVE